MAELARTSQLMQHQIRGYGLSDIIRQRCSGKLFPIGVVGTSKCLVSQSCMVIGCACRLRPYSFRAVATPDFPQSSGGAPTCFVRRIPYLKESHLVC